MVSVVVPLYNEKENVRALHEGLTGVLSKEKEPYEIIFVNDGSIDGTGEALDDIASGDRCIRVVHFTRNFGQTAATMSGFDFSRGEVIVVIDADLQYDPADILKLIRKLDEGFEVCMGWRKERKDALLTRKLPSCVVNMAISWLFGVRLRDIGCSLKAFRRDVAKRIRIYGEMHRYIGLFAHWQGARIAEIPVAHLPRKHGKSKYGLNRVTRIILDAILLKYYERYGHKPMYFFGSFGLGGFILSMATFACAIYMGISGRGGSPALFLAGIAILILVSGLFAIFTGLIADTFYRTQFESGKISSYVVREKRNIE
jgi:glycosyltransferase involved in cell wall biosynthesis